MDLTWISLLLVSRGEYSLQGDDEVQHQERLPVFVRLGATDVSDGGGGHWRQIRGWPVRLRDRLREYYVSSGVWACGIVVRHVDEVNVLRHRRRVHCHRRRTRGLTLRVTASNMDRNASSEIRKRECRLAIAAVHRSQQREKCLVRIDRQELTIAKRPALRGKIPTDDLDLSKKW